MKELIVHAKDAIVDLASSPKGALAAAAGAASAGTAAQLDIITGWLARGSVAIGFCTAVVVLAIQLLKLVREWRAYQNDEDTP
jgi:hypothetical protein